MTQPSEQLIPIVLTHEQWEFITAGLRDLQDQWESNMAFQCVKTGCNALIAGRSCHGDLYTVEDPLSPNLTYIMRVSGWSYDMDVVTASKMHLYAHTYDVWWDEHRPHSTVVLTDIEKFDYEGW